MNLSGKQFNAQQWHSAQVHILLCIYKHKSLFHALQEHIIIMS